jgi:polyisoprenyl-teichoic acid--peptidoglycan teichoic acid transferase
MPGATRRSLVASALSVIVPGAGHLYAGVRSRGLALLAISAGLVLAALVLAVRGGLPTLDRRLLVAVLLADAAVLAFRLFAVVDAWRVAGAAATTTALAGLSVLAVLTVAPHAATAYVAVRSYDVLDTVFADEAPHDVLPSRGVFLAPEPKPKAKPDPVDPPPPSRPLAASAHVVTGTQNTAQRTWTTLLLLGTDEGPGNWGARTDTIILAALEHGTGRAALFGIPRNLIDTPLVTTAARETEEFHQPINALYGFARSEPELFPGGRNPGATALKQTVSLLLGVRVDYYGLVNLRGFADLVDALGGVDVRVRERLVDEVTRPAWGEPKPRIDVVPGRTYHMFGREALAYVRSRKTSDDYTRMARQRCFLSAMADQFDAFHALRHFGRLASTIEHNVETDVPLNRVAGLLQLVSTVDPRKTVTQTFGREYIFGRRKGDEFPSPNVSRIRATARAVLLGERTPSRTLATTKKTC